MAEAVGRCELRCRGGEATLQRGLVLGPPADEPAPEFIGTRRNEQDSHRAGHLLRHLLGSLHIDLQHSRQPGGHPSMHRLRRCAVAVACEGCVLQQPPLRDEGIELRVTEEQVLPTVLLTGPLPPRGGRDRQPQVGATIQQCADHRSLPDTRGPRDHQHAAGWLPVGCHRPRRVDHRPHQPRAATRAISAARCW